MDAARAPLVHHAAAAARAAAQNNVRTVAAVEVVFAGVAILDTARANFVDTKSCTIVGRGGCRWPGLAHCAGGAGLTLPHASTQGPAAAAAQRQQQQRGSSSNAAAAAQHERRKTPTTTCMKVCVIEPHQSPPTPLKGPSTHRSGCSTGWHRCMPRSHKNKGLKCKLPTGIRILLFDGGWDGTGRGARV